MHVSNGNTLFERQFYITLIVGFLSFTAFSTIFIINLSKYSNEQYASIRSFMNNNLVTLFPAGNFFPFSSLSGLEERGKLFSIEALNDEFRSIVPLKKYSIIIPDETNELKMPLFHRVLILNNLFPTTESLKSLKIGNNYVFRSRQIIPRCSVGYIPVKGAKKLPLFLRWLYFGPLVSTFRYSNEAHFPGDLCTPKEEEMSEYPHIVFRLWDQNS